MTKKLFIGCLLALTMPWLAVLSYDAYAEDTYYYDKNGNPVPQKEYERIINGSNPGGNQNIATDQEVNIATPSPTGDSAVADGRQVEEEQNTEAENQSEEDDLQINYQIGLSSESLLRAAQRNTENRPETLVMPVYQYLRFDFGALDRDGLSLHMYGWGRYDIGNGNYYENNPDGELLYGYLEYSEPNYSFNLKAGRQHVMTGVINDTIDGLGVQSALTPYFKFSLFGGYPVVLSSENSQPDSNFYGGRAAAHIGSDYEIGFSYKKSTSDGEIDEEIAGFDLHAVMPFQINLSGSSAYNLDTEGWSEHLYELSFDIGSFYIQPYYQRYPYNDYFRADNNSPNPFRLLASTGETLSVLGSSVSWLRFNSVDLAIKANYYTYDLREDNVLYLDGNAIWHIGSLSQIGSQIAQMNGETSDRRYLLTRAFFYWDMQDGPELSGFLTGDVMFVHYDENIYGRDFSLWISFGGGWHYFNDALQIKLSGDWSNNPLFDWDLRGQLKISYVY